MNKIVKNMVLVAAAAMGFTACQKEFQEDFQEDIQPAEETVVVKFVAQSAETKTSVDVSGEAPVFSWNETETFAVLEQTDALAEATSVSYEKVDGKANIDAEFTANAGKGEYKYVTVYPENGYVSATSINAAKLRLPAEQTMAAGSYDPAADLMVSKVVTTDAQPAETQQVQFTRLAAVVKMTLTNFGLELGDNVQKVTFTAEGKDLAGDLTVNLATPDLEAATVSASSSSVTVNTTSAGDVYFTVLPTVLEAGDAYTVVVLTDKKLYVKQGTIPAEKSLAFEAGNVTRFNVNMSGVASSDKWVLVKDASTLKQGDVVTIAAKDYDKAISKKLYNNASETSTSAKRGLADASKSQDYLIASADVQPFVLVTGAVEGTFSFYDETREMFLVSTTTSSTYLINQEYCDVNTSFTITVDPETTIATITNTAGDYAGNLLRYNTNGYFVSNQNTSNVYKDVCIYKLDGATGAIPVVDANVTVPDSDESVVIAEEGTQAATEINEVVFNYVGDWTISVSDDADWLSVSYADGVLSYTAEANAGTPREAEVTITAAREGSEDISWSFNVLQKGAPIEISIAEFIKLSKDENTTYKLTGIVTQTATTSGTWKISDENGNVAQIKYLKTEESGNPYLSASENIKVEVGDVMTATVVVTASKATSACGSSTYPSIYKGHYGLTASAGLAAEYTGGTVEINVETYSNGSITLPESVVGSMEENDFATFSYDGGNAATATILFDENSGSSRSVDVEFTYGLTSTTVTVGQQNHPSVKVGWFLVTNINELAVGDKVIIAAKNPDETLDYAVKKYTSATASSTTGAAVKLMGNSISDVAGIEQFTLENGHADYPGTWAFKGDTYSKYLYPSSSSVKITSTLDSKSSWTIDIASDGKATLVSKTGTSSTKKNTMMFNYTSSNQTFGAYTSSTTGKGAIYLYKYYE